MTLKDFSGAVLESVGGVEGEVEGEVGDLGDLGDLRRVKGLARQLPILVLCCSRLRVRCLFSTGSASVSMLYLENECGVVVSVWWLLVDESSVSNPRDRYRWLRSGLDGVMASLPRGDIGLKWAL